MRLLSILFLLLLALVAEAQPCRVLILTGQSDLPYHHWDQTTPQILAAIRQTGRCEPRVVEEPQALTAAALSGYQALLLNYNGPRFSRATEEAIESFVRQGGGFIAFHLALYGEFYGMQRDAQNRWNPGPDNGWPAYPQIIGASWKPANIGHSLRHAYPVTWDQPAHPIARGLPADFTANDELYHRFDLAPTAQVIASAQSATARRGTGRREPIVWTHTFGQGRALFTTLGHDPSALYQPGVMNLFARAVEWAATGTVTTPPLDPHHATAAKPIRLLAVTGGHGYPTSFYAALDALPNVTWTHAPTHAEAFARPLENRCDVILLHDMVETITPEAQARLKSWIDSGGGVVSLHHAVVDYTSWPWWYEQVTGGKYFVNPLPGHPKSAYHEDVEFTVLPAAGKEKHPVLQGVPPLTVFDELYRGMWFAPGIEVLMETSHPENDRPVVYLGPHPQARSVYIQLGHSAHTLRHPGFQLLLRNSIEWAARRR